MLKKFLLLLLSISGKKTEKAREWGITLVNHTWLEDCFVSWKDITPAQEKYIMFPRGLSFAELVGVRGVGRIGFDVASPQELAAIEADVLAEQERKARARAAVKVEKVEETSVEGENEPLIPHGTGESQKEVEVVVGLMDVDDYAPMLDEMMGGEPEPELEPERSPSPSPLVPPMKKNGGRTGKNATKKVLVSEDEDEDGESQPRQISQASGRKRAAIEELLSAPSKKAQAARAGSSAKTARTVQSETEVDSDEEHGRRTEAPKEMKRGGASKASAKAQARSPSVTDDEEVREVIEQPAPRQTRSKAAARSPAKKKSASPSKVSQVGSDGVIHIDSG